MNILHLASRLIERELKGSFSDCRTSIQKRKLCGTVARNVNAFKGEREFHTGLISCCFFCVFSVETTSGRLLRLDIQSDSKARSNRWQCQQWCTFNSMIRSFRFNLLLLLLWFTDGKLSHHFNDRDVFWTKKYYLHTLKLVWAFGIDEPPYSRFEHVLTNALQPNKDRLSRYLTVASRDWSGRSCRADAFSFVRTPSQNKKLDFE